MSTPTGRPPIKLKLSTQALSREHTVEPSPKIRLKLNTSSRPSTPSELAPPPVPKPKKARKPKVSKTTENDVPSPKISKKRAKAPDDEDDVVEENPPQIKRLKLTSKGPVTPIIRAKLKGKPPVRPLGVGYDSEASDREEDPAIEEEFILRMTPGDDCNYLRKAIEEKKLGLPKRDGGADVTMKFFNRDGRRGVITIQGRHYAGTMVDLPCVIEGMKSWDRRGWWKSADICQMLIVTGPVATEEQALQAPLPQYMDEKTYQYSNGLTPPMWDVRRRRFRKRVSNKTIEAVEDEVERLLDEDANCVPGTSRFELVDLDRMTRDNSFVGEAGFNMLGNAGMHDAMYEEDADGEVDDTGYFEEEPNAEEDDDDDEGGLEADLEQAMMEDDDFDDVVTPATGDPVANGTPATPNGGAPTPSAAAAEATGEESSDEDADDEHSPEMIDEEELERQRELQRQKEEIADLENAIQNETVRLNALTNAFLRQKLVVKIRSLQAELDLKRGATGLEE
ncbi:MAG: hypothetical protein M1816_001139 [Peltula sp. TS41687]|nr:MAG: hypothetical protein M1816_001139 [Peltula sp. TS41687]